MKDFEDYTPDKFPFRDGFRSIKAFVSLRLFNRSDNNGIYDFCYKFNAHSFLPEQKFPLLYTQTAACARIFPQERIATKFFPFCCYNEKNKFRFSVQSRRGGHWPPARKYPQYERATNGRPYDCIVIK